jgi:hypothetical protein
VASILQPWVQELGLRHQGALLTAIRGCDTVPKDDPSKLLVRCLREVILRAHCGDAARAKTFIELVDIEELERRFTLFRKNCDHYPHHYVMHLTHTIEIVGYKHPCPNVRLFWSQAYFSLCYGLHVNPETESQLDERLNADENTFGRRQKA